MFRIVVLAAFGFTLASQAMSPFDHVPAVQKETKLPSNDGLVPDKCTDFSGNWKGTCQMGSEKPIPKTGNIGQSGCIYLVADGKFIRIGGLMTDVHTGPLLSGDGKVVLSEVYTSAVDWNDDKNGLVIQGRQINKEMGRSMLTELTYSGSIRLENGKLVTESTDSFSKSKCVYEKQ